MVNSVYPQGMSAAFVLTAANTLTTAFTGNQFEADLGAGTSIFGEVGAVGAIFYIDYSDGAETRFDTQIEAFDGTNWFIMDEYTRSTLTAAADGVFHRIHVQPMNSGINKIRISFLGTVGPTGTVAVKMRLSGVSVPVTGGVS